MFPRRIASLSLNLLSRPPLRSSSLINVILSRHTSSNSSTPTWEEKLHLATTGNHPVAQCEVGWSFHRGLGPDSIKDMEKAIGFYEKSASQGYAPASSLLGDIYYYNHDQKKDWSLAKKYLNDVVESTSPSEANDAYVRTKALQKLGLISYLGVTDGKLSENRAQPNKEEGLEHFNKAITICNKHFNCTWAFLLAHDPPGFWEQLENEEKLLGDSEVLGKLMSGLVCVSQGRGGDGSALSQIQYYTRALRKMENNPAWVVKWQSEVLDTFGADSDRGGWGVTYFTSFLRIFMEPIVQRTVSTGRGGVPKVVVLGSGLGNIVTWSAFSFGFRGVGLDVLPCCTEGATELYTSAVDAIERKNEILHQYKDSAMLDGKVPAAGVSDTIGKAYFDSVDVAADTKRVEMECVDANVVWINDYSWSEDDQRSCEAAALAGMPAGTVMVLYRPPHFPPSNSQLMKTVPVATSWNPSLEMHIVFKV
jgi:tetratricopeptide (TPR) repeat protein